MQFESISIPMAGFGTTPAPWDGQLPDGLSAASGDITDFRVVEHHNASPGYWFLEDKSWCVAVDVELYNTSAAN
ncbi:hypothetical protein [Alicyclobacillus fodiniaquatilis]|uniref:Uncharacterized protein n=1 Tax=Alicyclobacillus fodiniaquatilis TaxID=1661150 RepID=A0ABW4JJE7_9BACL